MSDRFTNFVADLSTGLAAALTDTTFSSGKPPDTLPPASVAVGFIWVDKWEQDVGNQLESEITAMVRVYPIQSEQFDGLTPIDPTPLYVAAAAMQSAVKTGWTPADGAVWFYDLNVIGFNLDEQYIEGEIVGHTWNDATVGN